MTCERWAEELALLANDDLDAERRLEVEQHVHGCPACARRLEEYRETRAAIAVTVSATPQMRSAVAPLKRRRWTPAVAAAAMLGVVLLVFTGPALAEWVQTVIRTLSPAETQAVVEQLVVSHQTRTEPDTEEPITAEAAAKRLGRSLTVPGYLPEGFTLDSVVWVHSSTPYVMQMYIPKGELIPTLRIVDFPPGTQMPAHVSSPEGAARFVTVGGKQALLEEGSFTVSRENGGTKAQWDPAASVGLTLQVKGHVVEVFATRGIRSKLPLPTAEVLKIGEGLK